MATPTYGACLQTGTHNSFCEKKATCYSAILEYFRRRTRPAPAHIHSFIHSFMICIRTRLLSYHQLSAMRRPAVHALSTPLRRVSFSHPSTWPRAVSNVLHCQLHHSLLCNGYVFTFAFQGQHQGCALSTPMEHYCTFWWHPC